VSDQTRKLIRIEVGASAFSALVVGRSVTPFASEVTGLALAFCNVEVRLSIAGVLLTIAVFANAKELTT
jgi:hypothetical protein